MVKLIALDGGQGQLLDVTVVQYSMKAVINCYGFSLINLGKLNLSKNYCEMCGLDTDVACLKTWMSKEKPFDQERKHLACILPAL